MKTGHYHQVWHDLQKVKHIHELLAYLPEHLLEKAVFIVLSAWVLSPLYILLRSVFLTGTDEQYLRLMLSSFWYVALQQVGFVGWLLALVSIAKNAVRNKDQGTKIGRKAWLSGRMVPLLLGLMLIWSILSCLTSDNRLLSFMGDAYRRDGLLSYLLYGGLFASATQVRSRSTVRRIMVLFVAVATLLALLTLISQPALNELFKIKSQSAVFYNANHYAYYLCLSQMGALFLYINGKKWSLGSLLWLSAFVVIAAALLDNGSLGP
ncbi:MAG: hypothetical protein SCM11_18525, partial [Bacillota bacterium]|nr:hypothetical protein [Bacillota bacterium]